MRLGRTTPWTKIVPAIHVAFLIPDHPRFGGAGNARVEVEIAHVPVVQQVILAE
jgi:hypothetical protein